ncbi:DUF397 domain-containing protein [Phytomonospora endophytica]|uniref:DUF397 domain-containing protein n=1 Tax=Phytomonospora endophytica TaxID=714109 RepID=A0A841FRT1_9ACTN|nr:DUF397 domain-containing protein [Phytomonospora endophytica]MBB6035259.1 hypothetical protein [Phytomonospora endophytica]GIG63992.1 hypothetical protein Pen01_02870 [Phytomonospora endophytica]
MTIVWRTSSRSNSGGGQCVEVASAGATIAIRDSKDKGGPILTCDRATWVGFLTSQR